MSSLMQEIYGFVYVILVFMLPFFIQISIIGEIIIVFLFQIIYILIL